MSLCENPYMCGGVPCPCGKCIPCLINRKRLWTHRILLESYSHDHSSFITLTYDDKHLDYENPDLDAYYDLSCPTLNPAHLRNFIKKIRRSVSPQRLRFYAVGEYGDRSWRPHYHIALFGYEPCWRGETRKDLLAKGKSCCPACDLLYKKWGKGGIDNARVENDSAGYIAGYVTKKLTKKDDTRLEGRHPEFSRMSRRPGIGALDIDLLSESLLSEFGHNALTEHGDVPTSLRHGERQLPLGKYLRQKIRQKMNFEEFVNIHTGEIKNGPQLKALFAYEEELQKLFKDNLQNPEIPQEKKLTLKKVIQERDAQKILNIKTRHKLKKRSKRL